MDKEQLEEMAEEYADLIAKAENKNEENKLVGKLLEDLVQQIFWEKGYSRCDHKVEDRRNPDILYGGLVMEIGNTKKYNNKGKLVEYSPKRLRAALRHLTTRTGRRYYLISHATALQKYKEKLEKNKVKILEIGSQVTPENLVTIYPTVRMLIDSNFQDIPKERSGIVILGLEDLRQEEKFELLWREICGEHRRRRLDIDSDKAVEDFILYKCDIRLEKHELGKFFKWLTEKFGDKRSQACKHERLA